MTWGNAGVTPGQPRATGFAAFGAFSRSFSGISGRFSQLSRTVFVAVELPGRIEQEYVAHIVAHLHGELCHKPGETPGKSRATDFRYFSPVF